MLVTMHELANANIKGFIGVPSGGGHLMSLSEDEITTLRFFEGIFVEVDPRSLPLQIYRMGGSAKRLAVYPCEGCIKIPAANFISLKEEGGVRELVIYREPKSE